MKKFLLAATLAVLPVLSLGSTAFAAGAIGGGNIVTSKNVTTNSAFADVTNVTCGDTVKIRAYVHNPGPDSLTGVRAKAELPTGTASSFSVKMTISAANANPSSESDTTSLKSNKSATISYVAGSAEYFDAKGARLGSLSDSIVTTGASVPGNVDVSTLNARYVQLQAKLNCPVVPPVEKTITVCELATKNIITIKEKDFDASKHSKDLADCAPKPPVEGEITVCEVATKKVVTIKESAFDSTKHSKDLSDCDAAPVAPVTPTTPTELPQTGATGLIAAIATIATAGAGYLVTARKNLLG